MNIKEFRLVREMNEGFGNPVLLKDNTLTKEHRIKIYNQCLSINDEIERELFPHLKDLKDLYLKVGNSEKENDDSKINQIVENYLENLKKIRDDLADIKVFAYGALHYLDQEKRVNESLLVNENYFKAMLENIKNNPVFKKKTNQEKIQIIINDIELRAKQISSQYHIIIKSAEDLVESFSTIKIDRLANDLLDIITFSTEAQIKVGANPTQDMEDVISGLFTRFCKDETELKDTLHKWQIEKGLEVYVEGEFPKAIVKSAKNQEDAPKDKFLKNVYYKDTVFKRSNILD